jgi:hypothetical protein
MGIVVAAKELGLVEQTLRNWVTDRQQYCAH